MEIETIILGLQASAALDTTTATSSTGQKEPLGISATITQWNTQGNGDCAFHALLGT